MNAKVNNKLISSYQAKYIAYELTRRFPSGSSERFNATLLDAQVDLNPHQVESALFAFKSPLSKGAILADEVGLGKTIEAGILLSQLYAEKRRRLLVICPANLRKQWSQELYDKFYLDSIILENKNFREFQKAGKRNPFDQKKIVICSYQFATTKADLLQLVSWDLAIIDEAHRLRNVYKPQNKIGNTLKNALSESRKVLLTATPLQNSLLELYGLVSIIDEQTFGDLKSFRGQFLRTVEGENHLDLRDRLKNVCIRNLRRQVREYIQYTNRIPLTIKFEPSDEEHELYGLVSAYLQRDLLYALPTSQRHLMTLILRKLLASSSFAIAGTLTSLINKLQEVVQTHERDSITEDIADDFENVDEYAEEYADEQTEDTDKLSEEEIEEIKQEIEMLTEFKALAERIRHNAKGEKLLTALKQGFANLQPGAARKAIIFTESTRTQSYLYELLQEEYKDKIVLFNGSNNDERSNKIYKSWLDRHRGTDKVSGSPTADKRAALVDFFREEATVMIATEAAAEGINLQFCSMVINYDLPWNPQRIEQRIGRCHRYGQKFDVVVVNFLNVKNAADVRVFQLLDEKFKLFSGVFGASDEVLGSIESGVDFEKRIIEIYQNCRSEREIQNQFDQLQKELEEQISQKMQNVRNQLLENFDDEVIEKLRVRMHESQEYLSKFEQWLWTVTKKTLSNHAEFDDKNLSFLLNKQPLDTERFALERYRLGKNVEDAHTYRIGHPLAQWALETAKQWSADPHTLTFDLTGYQGNISILNDLRNSEGWISVVALSVTSFEESDYLLYLGATKEGEMLSEDEVKRILSLPVCEEQPDYDVNSIDTERYEKDAIHLQLKVISERDNEYFKAETDKLNKWAEDRVTAAELAIKETKNRIKELNREALKTTDTQQQLKIQSELQELSRKQKKQRQEIFNVEDEITEMRNSMIADIQKRMKQDVRQDRLFAIGWKII